MPTRIDLGIYTMSVDLDDVTFQFRFTFNGRERFWYMDISDNNASPIQSGIKIVSDFIPMRLEVDIRRPLGSFTTVNLTTDPYFEAGLQDLGKSVLLLYSEV